MISERDEVFKSEEAREICPKSGGKFYERRGLAAEGEGRARRLAVGEDDLGGGFGDWPRVKLRRLNDREFRLRFESGGGGRFLWRTGITALASGHMAR